MGYYTDYRVFVDPEDKQPRIEHLLYENRSTSNTPNAETWAHSAMTDRLCAKWYDWREDMAYLSRKYGVRFLIFGMGENMGDDWTAIAENGECTDKQKLSLRILFK